MSAAGLFIPPMFTFPQQKAAILELLEGASPESNAEFYSTGSMQSNLLIKWFNHFIIFAKPTKEQPVLLQINGHATQTKSIEFIDLARVNHVTLPSLPPHCAHRLQPLDVAFIGPISQYYSVEAKAWVKLHPEKSIRFNQIGKFFGAAYMKAAFHETAINGFKRTGIYPFNPNVFLDRIFKSSESMKTLQSKITDDQEPVTLLEIAASSAAYSTSAFEVSPKDIYPIIQTTRNRTSIFCNALFTDSLENEHCVQCAHCKNWAHDKCATAIADQTDFVDFICDYCIAL